MFNSEKSRKLRMHIADNVEGGRSLIAQGMSFGEMVRWVMKNGTDNDNKLVRELLYGPAPKFPDGHIPTPAELHEADKQIARARRTDAALDLNENERKVAVIDASDPDSVTHEVYRYVRDRVSQGAVAIKGSSKRNSAAVGKGSKVDVNWRGKVLKKGVTLYMLGTDTIKTTLFGRLRHNEAGGSLNFGQAADEEYFRQLTAERQALRYHRGFPIREWVKKSGDRNEALDCAVYAYAAMLIFSRKMNRATMWEQLGEQLDSGNKAKLRLRKSPANAGGNFVSSW